MLGFGSFSLYAQNNKTPQNLVNPHHAQKYFKDKVTYTVGPMELVTMVKEGAPITIIDVRAEKDFLEGHIPGAINLPKDKWHTLEGLQKNKNNIIYCYVQTCHLAAHAALEFAKKGFPVMEMEGGFKAWKEQGLEVVK
ncbi:MAG: rhodanese-like domain-containing protein [Alphaproteobacteria bacterium]|nr:rhodanese-like domain-containing protein [Alphaproteobacteria bacterium]